MSCLVPACPGWGIKMQNKKPDQKELPDKLYFKVGEVSAITGVPAYVLRFWETEFKRIKPKRTASGHRLYRKIDIELILKIKHLLYDEKFTIRGAKQHLRAKTGDLQEKSAPITVDEIRSELKHIRALIK